jgi:hypothetical protein
MPVELSTLFAAGAGSLAAAFRWAVPVTLAAAVVLIVIHLTLVVSRRGETPARPRWKFWEILVYWATVLSVAWLGVTSFFAVLRYGVLDGWLLFVHMFGAGALVAVLPLLAITFAEANRFGSASGPDGTGTTAGRFFWLPKLMFWLLLISGLAVSVTMLVSMLPLFGTEGMNNLLDVHRYSGLAAVVAMVLSVYGVVLQRLGLR